MRDAAGKFDDFQTALNIAFGIGNDLAVFGRQPMRQVVHIAFDQTLEFEHDTGAALRIGGGPGWKRPRGRGDRGRHFVAGGQGHARLNLAGIGIEDVAKTLTGACNGLTGNIMGQGFHGALPYMIISFYALRKN